MSTWIQYDESLRDHFKVHRLAKLLSLDYAKALGTLSCLWCWAVSNARDGQLKRFTDEELAFAARWEGEAKRLRQALRQAELLDKNQTIHDWKEHGTRLLDAAKTRVARHRQARSNTPVTLQTVSKGGSKKASKKERKTDAVSPTPFEAWQEVRIKVVEAAAQNGPVAWSHPAVKRAAEAIGYTELRNARNLIATRAHFVRAYEEQLAKEAR